MNRLQTGVGAGVVLAGIGLLFGASRISSDAGYGGVGPNFLPWVVGAVLLLCGLLLVWQAWRGGFQEMEAASGAADGDWWGFAWVSAGLLANAALITHIGFVLSCSLCYLLAVRGCARAEGRRERSWQSWLRDGLTGLAISAPVYWMFGQLLGIQLPGLTGTGWL